PALPLRSRRHGSAAAAARAADAVRVRALDGEREGELPLHASDRIRAEPTGRTQELDERTRRYDVDVADAKRVREEPADEADRLGDRDVHEPVSERRRDRVPLLCELRQRRSPVAPADVEMFDAGMPAAAEAP